MRAYVDNDNLLRGANLRTVNVTTGAAEYLTGAATVTVTIVDAEDVELTGETWPLALSYVAGSQGDFLGVLRNELTWEDGEQWYAVITVDAGVDQHGEFMLPIDVLARVV